jgi:ACS family hexuronate transporter-like MFS transporter
VLSLLAPSLSQEFGWSNTDYANIAAAFQLVYAVSQLFAGRIVDWLGTRRAFLVAIVVWSAGAVAHAYSIALGSAVNSVFATLGLAAVPVSVAGFIAARALLAFGEAANFPAAVRATAEYFPKAERSFATGIFNSGANIGAILAPLTVPLIASLWGWPAAFIWVGAIGFIWMGFWYVLYDEPARQRRLGKVEYDYIQGSATDEAGLDLPLAKTSWFALLRVRATWSFVLGKFLTDGVWWFFLFWLPKYLSGRYGMGASELVVPLTVLYSMTMVGSIGGGWLPAWFMRRGDSVVRARSKAMLLIACFPLVVLLAQPLGQFGFWIPVLLIGIGAAAHQAWSANLLTTVSDMFPKHSVGSVVGIGGLAGGIGAVLMTKLGGQLFDYYGALGQLQTGYMIMFAICAGAYLVAWSVMRLLAPVRQVATLPAELTNA